MTPTERAVIAAASAYVEAQQRDRAGKPITRLEYWKAMGALEEAVKALGEEKNVPG